MVNSHCLSKTIYVAYQPKVEIIVNIKTIEGLKSDLDNSYLTWIVGGLHFSHTNKQATALADGEESESSSDKITIEPVFNTLAEEEAYVESLAEQVVSNMSDEQFENTVSADADEIAMSEFFNFPCMNAGPNVLKCLLTPLAKKEVDTAAVTTQHYKITMESKSEAPQILGVVNEILPSL